MTKRQSLPFFFLLLLKVVLLAYAQTSLESYCGYSWDDAALQCLHPCPSGADSDCSTYETTGVAVAGDDMTESAVIYGCYFFTGCKVKIDNGLISPPTLSPAPSIGGGGGGGGGVATTPLEEGGSSSGGDDDVVQNWLSSSPTIIISSYELVRLELIFSLMNIMSTLEIGIAIDTYNTTMFNYITDVLTSVDEKGGEATGRRGVRVNMTNITNVRLGESFDFVDVYITVDVLFNPYNMDVTMIEDKETWVVNEISDNLLMTPPVTSTTAGNDTATATATTKTLVTYLKDAGLVPTVTTITVRKGGKLEQPTSQESNVVTITGGILNSSTVVVVSLTPSTYPTTTSTNATTNDTVSVGGINGTTPSPTVIAAAAVAIPALVQPTSFGGITSATLPTTLPSLSQVPSLSHAPSIINLTTTTTATAAKVKENNGTTTTTTGIVIGVTMSLLLLCLVSGGCWLYRTKKNKKEEGGEGRGEKSFLPVTLSPFRANANRKHSLSTRESSTGSIIVEKELEKVEEENESCQSNEILEQMGKTNTPSKKKMLHPQSPPRPLPRSVMQSHRTTSDPTLSATRQSNELKSSFTSGRRLSSSDTLDYPIDLDDLRLSMKGNSNNKTREVREARKSSLKKIDNKNEEANKRGIERSQSAKMSSVEREVPSSRYNHLSKSDSKIPFYNPGELKSSPTTAKKKSSRGITKTAPYREKSDRTLMTNRNQLRSSLKPSSRKRRSTDPSYPSNDNIYALRSSMKRSDNHKEKVDIDKNHHNYAKNSSPEALKSSLLLRSSMKHEDAAMKRGGGVVRSQSAKLKWIDNDVVFDPEIIDKNRNNPPTRRRSNNEIDNARALRRSTHF